MLFAENLEKSQVTLLERTSTAFHQSSSTVFKIGLKILFIKFWRLIITYTLFEKTESTRMWY